MWEKEEENEREGERERRRESCETKHKLGLSESASGMDGFWFRVVGT